MATRRASRRTGRALLAAWRVAVVMLVAPLPLGPLALAQEQGLDFLLSDESAASASDDTSGKADDDKPDRREETTNAQPQPGRDDAGVSEPPKETPPVSAGPARGRVIEEIVVTAQKREQNIREVPISMSILDADFLNRAAITDLEAASRHVPNVSIDETATENASPDVRVRGFGSPNNRASEQAVGLVIDGIPYGKGEYFQAALFDVERVEILRGPQGTLFGKNNSAGLFHLITKDPGDELAGYLDVELGELERRRFEGAVGGPVVPNFLNVRIAGLDDERDGTIENTTARVVAGLDDRLAKRDRKGLRVKLGFPDLFGANLVLGYERFDLDNGHFGTQLTEVPDSTKDLMLQFDPNTDFDPDNFVGSIDRPGFQNREIQSFVANGSHHLMGWDLDAIAGYSELESVDVLDVDFTPVPLATQDAFAKNDQITFEVRATSPTFPGFFGLGELFGWGLGQTDFLAGFFYQRRTFDDFFHLGIDAIFLATQPALDSPRVPLPPDIVDPRAFTDAAPDDTTSIFFDQTSNAFAGFGQLSWMLAERWTLLGGLRIANETKQADWRRIVPPTSFLFRPVINKENFTAEKTRSELEISPKVSSTYDWSDDISIFASWGKGFRAGGFNERSARGDEDDLTFDSEETSSWELGTKMKLLGGTASLNLGLFRMNVTNFQIPTQDPSNFDRSVENVAEALSQGVEADATWLPTDWLTLRGSLGFNDTELLEFPIAPCSSDRENTDGDDDPRCDVSGQPLPRAPKWTTTFGGDVRAPLSEVPAIRVFSPSILPGLDVIGGLTVHWEDTQFLSETFDPRTRQDSAWRLAANFGFGDLGQGWSLRIVGENLMNEVIAVRKREVSGTPLAFQEIVEPPRLLYGELRWVF